MKEIVFIRQSADEIGGVEGQILKCAQHLFNRRCLRPVLITSDIRSSFAQVFAERSFEVFAVPMSRAKILSVVKILSAAKKIETILTGRDVAVIQTHLFREGLIGRAVRRRMTGIPHVLRAQTYINCSNNCRAAKSLYYLLDKATSKYVDIYIANGRYLADEIVNRSKIDSHKVVSVLDGCDRIGPPDEPYSMPDSILPMKIAMISNLKPAKGHDCLIKALALLNKKKLRITVRLIGGESTGHAQKDRKPNTADQIKQLATKLGVYNQLEFYGYTRNIYTALEGIPVVVLPSDSEGVPNCILEAMSLRKLVVVSNTGGVSEMIDNGESGLIHQPKDYQGFADCLEKVFTTPAGQWEKMRNAGFQKWQEEFTSEKMVDKLVEIYRKIGVL
jgi:glycosyltransferase involved in cell wall biosynthesis